MHPNILGLYGQGFLIRFPRYDDINTADKLPPLECPAAAQPQLPVATAGFGAI